MKKTNENKIKNKVVKANPKTFALCALTKETKEPRECEETEYETDFFKWAHTQAKLLKKREFEKLDIDHLIEEIEDLSKREKQRLTNCLEILLMHTLKVEYQPGMHTTSWDASIKEATFKAQKTLKENPSLKLKLKEIFADAYFTARLRAVIETGLEEKTFPKECKWQLKDVFPDLEKRYQ